MDPHLIELPRRILVGKDVISKTPYLLKSLGVSGNGLVLSGPHTMNIGERIADDLRNIYKRKGNDIYSETVNESTLKEVERIKSKTEGTDFIICVGGGKVIDVGKLIAFDMKKPFISVPTAPSHDGIASERVSIRDADKKYSIRAKPPVGIIADIKILKNAPYRLIASGGADIISNYSAIFDWKLARKYGEYYSQYAASLSLMSARIVLKSAKLIRERKERGIRNLVEALISSSISMSLAGSSRPASGSEHLFSHALDFLGSNRLHGEQCGLGCILISYLQGQDWRRIRHALMSIGAPVNAREIDIKEETIIDALLKAKNVKKDRYTILNEKRLDTEKVIEICKMTNIID